MLFVLGLIKSYVIKEVYSNRYIVGTEQSLRTTPEITEATEFDLVPTNIQSEFLIYKTGTDLVWDDPGFARGGLVYLHPKHGKPNQKFMFVFNVTGSFTIISESKRMVYNPTMDGFRMQPPVYDDGEKTGYVIIDLHERYWRQFVEQPLTTYAASLARGPIGAPVPPAYPRAPGRFRGGPSRYGY